MKDTTAISGETQFNEKPSMTIIKRIAEREGKNPVDLPPLYYTIDPEAIDTLCCPSGARSSEPQISFTYCGYEVSIQDDGEISTTRPE